MTQETRTKYHTYVGVFVIVSSCILIAWTSASVLSSSQYLLQQRFALIVTQVLYSTLSLAVDIIGLVSGIMSLLRRNFVFAVVGVSFVLLFSFIILEGAISILLFNLEGAQSNYPGIVVLPMSIVAVCLSLLAVVFIVKAKGEFLS